MGERTWQWGKVRAWDEEVMSGLGSPKCHHIHPPKRGAKGALPPERRRLHDEKAGAEPPATGLGGPLELGRRAQTAEPLEGHSPAHAGIADFWPGAGERKCLLFQTESLLSLVPAPRAGPAGKAGERKMLIGTCLNPGGTWL